jgi:hypothetical protein
MELGEPFLVKCVRGIGMPEVLWDHVRLVFNRTKGKLCRCSGYRGIPVHLLLGLFNGPASAQGGKDDRSYYRRPSWRCLMRRTMTKTAKDQKTSSQGPAGEERDHVHISTSHLCAEQEDKGQKTAYCPRYPRQEGDQLSSCLHKVA